MKKFILFPLAALLLCACTTKEQAQQIRLFWLQQYANLMSAQLQKKLQTVQNNPQLAEMLKQMQTQIRSLPQQAAAVNSNKATASAQSEAAQPVSRRTYNAPQIMEVTLDTDALPGKAPHEDRVRMKRALEAVQISNQNTLNDIAATFGDKVKYQAFLLTADTERKLKQTASTSANFNAYLAAQKKLIQTQNWKLNQLMQQNADSIKNIRR